MTHFSTALVTRTIAHRQLVIAIAVIVFLLSCAGLSRLTIDSDLRVFFSKDNRVFTRDVLKVIRQLTKDLWQTPASSRVDSLTNSQQTSAEGNELIVEDPAWYRLPQRSDLAAQSTCCCTKCRCPTAWT